MKPTLLIPIGGLGRSQLDEMVSAARSIPGVEIANISLWDAYRDVPGMIWPAIRQSPGHQIYLLGHSLGASTARNTANSLISSGLQLAGVFLLDHVDWEPGPFECKFPGTEVYQAENSFPFYISQIQGFIPETILNTTHNSLSHSPLIIQSFITNLTSVVQK